MDEQRNMSSIFDQIVEEQAQGVQGVPEEGMPMDSAPDGTADETAIPQSQDGIPLENAPAGGVQAEAPQQDGVPAEAPPQGVAAETPDINQILGMTNQIIQQLQAENQRLTAQLQQSGQAVQQQSDSAQAAIEQAMVQPPVLDLSQLQYADDEQKAAMSQQYSNDVLNYVRSQMEREYAPMMNNYRQMEQNQANEAARSKLSQLPGFNENAAVIDNIIAKTPELAGISNPEQRFQIAYLMAEGLKKMNAPPPSAPTTDDILKMAMDNPDVLRMIKEREAQGIAQQNQGLPQFSASSGISSAPANVPQRPETMQDAWSNIEKNGLRGGSAGYFAY